MKKPIIGVLCCARMIDDDSDLHHVVFRSYIDFITDKLNAIPILIPSVSTRFTDGNIERICEIVDGFFLPGSPSNVALRRVKGSIPDFMETETPGTTDLLRDYTAMNIIHYAMVADKPLLAVCRGFQELNIFFGGELHKVLHQLPGRLDHRAQSCNLFNEKYDLAHDVSLCDGSLLKRIFPRHQHSFDYPAVNSLHSQGVSEIGDGLFVECLATDGTIEAIRYIKASFIYGVQWHLEWLKSSLDRYIVNEFITHCNRRMLKENNRCL